MAIKINTHEQYVQRIYRLALRSPTLTKLDKEKLRAIKLVYGDGPDGLMGRAQFDRWQTRGGKKAKRIPFVSVCGHSHGTHMQLCDTVLHELAHVMAGPAAGHGPEWKKACDRIGLPGANMTGGTESWELFSAFMRKLLRKVPRPKDGLAVMRPALNGSASLEPVRRHACSLGHGTRGGVSRGPGSGSRQLLWECGCDKPVKIRHAGRELKAKCMECRELFHLVEKSVPIAQQQGDATHPGAKELRDAYLRQAAATRKAFRAAGMI